MTVAELREELLEYPQDALVVHWDDFRGEYALSDCTHIVQVGMSNEGLFSVPLVQVF